MIIQIFEGDCIDILDFIAENSIDSIVTDPPYGLSFMGKKWDYNVPRKEIWIKALKCLKPGGHLVSFSSTRTYHRSVIEIEDAGFEIRDQIGWIYGSGFPKSHNLSGDWQGWGTALKPSWEPIVLARKPFTDTVAANVLAHGTGAMNIGACRVETTENLNGGAYAKSGQERYDGAENWRYRRNGDAGTFTQPEGRWPANVIHDGSDEVMDAFAEFGDKSSSRSNGNPNDPIHGVNTSKTSFEWGEVGRKTNDYRDTGTAARFFYCAKASKTERNGSKHPTVKPLALMRYLCRLITPKNGIVLDPFAGSGTTGQAALDEGFQSILIEREKEYCDFMRNRFNIWINAEY